jgi:hypothetical protein
MMAQIWAANYNDKDFTIEDAGAIADKILDFNKTNNEGEKVTYKSMGFTIVGQNA